MTAALKGALSGSVEAVMLGLMKTPAQYDASELKGSMKVREPLLCFLMSYTSFYV